MASKTLRFALKSYQQIERAAPFVVTPLGVRVADVPSARGEGIPSTESTLSPAEGLGTGLAVFHPWQGRDALATKGRDALATIPPPVSI